VKATATLKLHIDIDQAREMGVEIDDPKEYAIEEMVEWIYEMAKSNDIAECIHIEIEGEKYE
jgi:hypothetical protein